jgi:hypothetical protein
MATPSRPLSGNSSLAHTYRIRAGAYVRALRLDQDLTQMQLAQMFGDVTDGFVSSVENGNTNVPPGRYDEYIRCLHPEPVAFADEMCRWGNPWLFMLYHPEQRKAVEKELKALSPPVQTSPHLRGPRR